MPKPTWRLASQASRARQNEWTRWDALNPLHPSWLETLYTHTHLIKVSQFGPASLRGRMARSSTRGQRQVIKMLAASNCLSKKICCPNFVVFPYFSSPAYFFRSLSHFSSLVMVNVQSSRLRVGGGGWMVHRRVISVSRKLRRFWREKKIDDSS